ncbi:MAG: S-formylglutathione hydrolase [SAR86 cluster bacterium]|uniref:S-formylglutathione hydrolase n=1 Tax=SAR86 cluster bacterium TaxID=2030880 RepID=A0A2A4MIY2_9GAMM|nr:MAG: S-formylglutathione hydrolase [SAR86 cluster bacterium]
MSLKKIASYASFGGEQQRFSHQSQRLNCSMNFAIYLPPIALSNSATNTIEKLPVLYWLSGLTCNDENFIHKAGAQRLAAQLGLIIVCPDTSPRGEGVMDDAQAAYDLGLGAGFYVNASEDPWQANYQMYDYIVHELPALIAENFPVNAGAQAISGHSMGGHGALTIALKNPDKYRSVSAFAPITAPMQCAWGIKALGAYLGEDSRRWQDYDASCLVKISTAKLPLLIDQGSEDQFLESQLKPQLFLEAAKQVNYPVEYNLRQGYDHSYYFIASFIESHLHFHARHLKL